MEQNRIEALDRYFRATNFLTVGQIYLRDNPLLREPLKKEHIKSRLLGHFGTSPGLNFIYAHLNRLIQDTEANILYVTGPGHGGPALRANVYLEGTMTDVYPDLSWDANGILKLMREFSWPGGVPSHVSPPTPGSIHEGGELGYSLVHAYGAAFDNPDLIVACVVGDGEAETGPLAASWQSNKFLNPARDGAVLPILHLNGYKISGPTLFGRMDDESLRSYFQGLGYEVHFIEGDDPNTLHLQFAGLLDSVYEKIREIQSEARENGAQSLFHFPMIIMRTPKGWTGPKFVDGKKIEGTFRSHQVPISEIKSNPEHLAILEGWMKSYRPEELFDKSGKPYPEILEIVPKDSAKMGKSPYGNGGLLLKELELPNAENYVIDFSKPGSVIGEATRNLGMFVRDVFKKNPDNFRLFCPDETNSNRFNHVFEVTDRMYIGEIFDWDENLSATGRVMEVLSEHLCQGWLEGYLLTGRHGLFPCYEAFALIVDSMLNQHAKWLKACLELPWRKPVASLNYILTSHAWRQDHNGYSHQGPGFIESVLSKKSTVARIYLPPDANTLLFTAEHCLKSKNYVNLIIAGKQPMEQWLDKESAKEHCKKGASIWEWASTSKEPEVVFASSGDVPTKEVLAAIDLLRSAVPDIRIQMVNVLDLCTLSPSDVHPHGLDDTTFNTLFPKEVPVIFAFHGHPRVIHELAYRRERGRGIHVRGYMEEGTTTTPFDMVVENGMSRFHLAMLALEHVPRVESDEIISMCEEKLKEHKRYIYENGSDLPEIVNWQWKS